MIPLEIRKEARKFLEGKWGMGVCITLAYIAISFLIGFIIGLTEEGSLIYYVLELLDLIISVPFALGISYAFIKLKRNEEIKAFDFINIGFSNFARAWKIELRLIIKMILPIICVIASVILYGILFVVTIFGKDISTLWLLLSIAITILGVVYAVVIGLLYSLIWYIAYDNPEMSALEVVNKSAELMRGHRGDLFLLNLSFIGWAILTIFTLGIGCLWLIPYMQIALVCFYDKLKENNETVS